MSYCSLLPAFAQRKDSSSIRGHGVAHFPAKPHTSVPCTVSITATRPRQSPPPAPTAPLQLHFRLLSTSCTPSSTARPPRTTQRSSQSPPPSSNPGATCNHSITLWFIPSTSTTTYGTTPLGYPSTPSSARDMSLQHCPVPYPGPCNFRAPPTAPCARAQRPTLCTTLLFGRQGFAYSAVRSPPCSMRCPQHHPVLVYPLRAPYYSTLSSALCITPCTASTTAWRAREMRSGGAPMLNLYLQGGVGGKRGGGVPVTVYGVTTYGYLERTRQGDRKEIQGGGGGGSCGPWHVARGMEPNGNGRLGPRPPRLAEPRAQSITACVAPSQGLPSFPPTPIN